MFRVAILILLLLAACTQQEPTHTDFTYCDALNPCAEGDCYKFHDLDAPICWSTDPCMRCASSRCRIAESYPMQVFCE